MEDAKPGAIERYPFSYYDEMRKRWVRARYVAHLEAIKATYPKYRIEGPPEIRQDSSFAESGLPVGLRRHCCKRLWLIAREILRFRHKVQEFVSLRLRGLMPLIGGLDGCRIRK